MFYKVLDHTNKHRDGRFVGIRPERLSKVIVHRCGVNFKTGVNWGPHADDVADKFRKMFGQNTYCLLIDELGGVTQVTELLEKTSHARRFNAEAIGIGLIWDPRYRPIPHEMNTSLTRLCTLLCAWVGGVDSVLYGHDELDGASSDPGKQCPGKFVSMDSLRKTVGERVDLISGKGDLILERDMLDAGLVI